MERDRHSNGNGDYFNFRRHQEVDRVINESKSPTSSSSSQSSPASRSDTPPFPRSRSPVGGVGVAVNYIEHRVSKMDTLAGVAIKYGVEVADIKRINGLVVDLQMFALKSLRIPLPGRHPPSPSLSNGLDDQGPSNSEETPPRRRHSDLFESLSLLKLESSPQPRISPAMTNLQGYYGLKPSDPKTTPEGFEMAVYRQAGSHYAQDGPFSQLSPLSNHPLNHLTKSKSIADGFLPENGKLAENIAVTEAREGDSDKWNEKFLRRRQKSEADFSSHTRETLLKEDTTSGGGFSAITGKGLALRPKAASRTSSGADAEASSLMNPISIGLGDSIVSNGFDGVRKSSSTSSLHDEENSSSSSSSIWTTSKWSLKPDLQAFSTAAITRPIFDGLPKPITGRRGKAALD